MALLRRDEMEGRLSMIVSKKSARFTIGAFKLVSAVLGLIVLAAHTPTAFADTNTNYNITYIAPWASGATVDPNNINVNVCLETSIGAAEACIAQYAQTYHSATLSSNGWVPSIPSSCPQINLQPTACFFGQFLGGGNPNYSFGQYCDFGGNYVAP